ncbi:MAG: GatB/YqeY domain-containing protein [Litorivicinaceae bacterium]
MSLKDTLTEAMKTAMREKAKFELGVIRMALSEIKRVEVDERIELDDARILQILDNMTKQRREAASQITARDRQDLADTELAEVEILKRFLPQPLSEAEVDALIQEAIVNTGASGPQGMGQVMGYVKPRAQGRADMQVISQRVKAALA